ncbi:MAG: hypothetical protein A4S09_06805 [Proteobacteria bacterium SG_bin7]|nr:MAG: hypothetical protein A4S09_06805 [Proteobacteria bacterium SG_bin7]
MRFLFLFQFLFSSLYGVCVLAQTKPTPISIKTAVGMAIEKFPDAKAARAKLEEAESSRRATVAKAFPTVSLVTSASEAKAASNGFAVPFNGNPYSQYRMDLTVTQPLYAGGALSAGIKYSNKELEIRRLDLAMSDRDLTFNVIQSFYSVLLQQRQADLLKQVETVLKKALTISERYFKIGRGQKADVLQIKSKLALLTPRIAQAENRIIQAVSQLAVYLELSENQKISLIGNLAPLSKEFINRKKSVQPGEVPEIKRADLLVEQFGYKSKVEMSKHWPTLNAVGGIGRNAFSNSELFNESAASWSFGLQLTVPLFTGLSFFSERRVYAAQESALVFTAQKTQTQARSTQVQSERDLDVAEQMLLGSQSAAKFSMAALKEAEREYRLQIGDYLRLISAEENHVDSATAYNQAKYDYILALAKFYNAMGIPLNELVEALEKNQNREE